MMPKLELDDDLRRIGLSKRKDPKLLLAKMSALNIKYAIPSTPTNKCAVILWAGPTLGRVVICLGPRA